MVRSVVVSIASDKTDKCKRIISQHTPWTSHMPRHGRYSVDILLGGGQLLSQLLLLGRKLQSLLLIGNEVLVSHE